MTNEQIVHALYKRDLSVYNNLSMLADTCIDMRDRDNLLNHPGKDLMVEAAKKVRYIAGKEAHNDPQFMKLYWKANWVLAPHDFYSYMLYLEKDRLPQSRFFLPRQEPLVRHGAVQLLQDLEDNKIKVASLSLPPGTGKAQPLYSKVLTPSGFRNMGDLILGDKVMDIHGTASEVIGIFPQGKKSVYEMVLWDGRKARFSFEHLCQVYNHQYGCEETVELKDLLGKYSNYSGILWQWDGDMDICRIRQIRYVGEEECQCIYVSDPSHLYITDDYIVTHNTTLGEMFISWIIGRHPEDYNLFVSHSISIDKMFYNAINEITTSAEYHFADIFPTCIRQGTNAQEMYINYGGYKVYKSLTCVSVGQNLAGRVRCNHLLYCDDLISTIEEAMNKDRLDKLWTSYSVDLLQRRKDPCRELHVATRWAVGDVIGRLQKKYEGSNEARFISVPALDPDTGESNFHYKYGVGFTKEYFEDMKDTMDPVSYKCLFENKPIEREGLLYDPDTLRTYHALPSEEPECALGVCDCKNEGKDYMFLPVFYKYGSDYYYVDCVCSDDTDFDLQYQMLAGMIMKHKVMKVDFESNNGGSRIADNVEKLLQGKSSCSIATHWTSKNKQTKILIRAEWVKKNVIFPSSELYARKSPMGISMNFLTTYTTMGKNNFDDVPDGMSQFADMIESTMVAQTYTMDSPF